MWYVQFPKGQPLPESNWRSSVAPTTPQSTATKTAPAKSNGERVSGKVKWFDEKKGFGFITPDAGGRDLFVHYSSILGTGFKTLDEGQPVTFETQQDAKGPKAVNVSAE